MMNIQDNYSIAAETRGTVYKQQQQLCSIFRSNGVHHHNCVTHTQNEDNLAIVTYGHLNILRKVKVFSDFRKRETDLKQ